MQPRQSLAAALEWVGDAVVVIGPGDLIQFVNVQALSPSGIRGELLDALLDISLMESGC